MDDVLDKSWIKYTEKPSVRSYIVKSAVKLFKACTIKKDLQEIREFWESYAKLLRCPSDIEISSTCIEDVNCEWIYPKSPKGKKTIVYLHGGGYVFGSLNTARDFARMLAKYTGEKVLSVGYRLAPENPFPAALEDALAVFRGLAKQNFLSADIVLVGDSAGGGLCLSTVLTLKDKKEPLPGAVVCISPWTDLAATGESMRVNVKRDPIFGKGVGVINIMDYASQVSFFSPYVSPLYGNYEGFPPILIHVGTDEVILDDSIRVAKKAKEAGAKVSVKVWKGMWHVFTSQARFLPEARESFKEIAEFIDKL
jgi:acetyl esterase/lipase